LLRVQFIRTSMRFLRARAALAAAAALRRSRPAEARSLMVVADRAARLLGRERMPCPEAYSRMIRGALAALRGDSERAASLLGEAVACFDVVDMRLCSAAVRRRLGELIGGDRGRAEVRRADGWMSEQKIHDPARMAAMILVELC
jgi:eukaryotic-like serine/threonine-protein kinase